MYMLSKKQAKCTIKGEFATVLGC